MLAQVGLAGRDADWPGCCRAGRSSAWRWRVLWSAIRVAALDEPLGALDALTRIEMQDLVTNVWQDKGFTAIIVTHDVTEAVALGGSHSAAGGW